MAATTCQRELSKLFNKFKKDELLQGLKERGILEKEAVDSTGTKKAFVNRILGLCFDGNATADHVATVDLLYHQTQPSCKKWTVYKLTGFESDKQPHSLDPLNFRTQMKSSLELYLKVEIFVQMWKNSLWTRLHMCQGSSNSHLTNTVFIVYHPHSQYVFMTAVKGAHKQYILQTLCSLLHCQSLEEVKLSGRDMFSLKELVLSKKSQGAFSRYRWNQVDINPLSRKRKRDKEEKNLEMRDITNEETHDDIKRQQFTENTYGCNPQPVLEKVEFKMQTRLRCSDEIPLSPRSLSCTVKFEGPNVLEGIKNLTTQSFVDVPLPSYLTNLHSLSKNSFVLREKNPKEKERIEDQSCTADSTQLENKE